ncbi:uncharacterized protein LOC119835625 isoform X2 [Zerene cesonia]|nr:uncharacterized protein LOC119835625 isoform X2 [Zerene cesonia]XP_038216490.1 uncharacterized protein LOC119835625 isoform X2 [Zerene cesonia]
MNSTNDSDMMHFTIKTLDSRDHPFDLDNNITVLQLKHEIHARMGINVNMQRLIFCGRVLQDEKKLADYNVAGKVVHLVERAPNSLRGPARPPSNPNPNVDPNETTFSIQEQEYLFSPNHSPTMTRILCLKTLLRTLRTSIKACKATDPDQDSSSSSEESDEEDAYGPYLQRARTHSRPADLADLSDQLHDLEEQFEPYREQYMLCLREANDPSITLSERTLQRRQRLSDRVRAVFHHLSHAYHLLSDINLLLSHNASRLTSEMLVENRPLSPIQAQVNVVSTNRSGHRGGTASAQHGHRSNSQFTNSGQAASNQGQARSSSQTTNSNARNLNQPTGWSRGQMNQDTSGNRATASDNTKTDTDEQAMNLDPAEGSGRATGGAPNKDEDPNVDRTAAHSAGSNQSTNTNNKDAKNQNQTTNSNPNANQNQNRGRNPNQPTVNIEVHDPITVQVQIETRVPIPLQPMMGNMDQRGQNAARNPNQDARANQQGNQGNEGNDGNQQAPGNQGSQPNQANRDSQGDESDRNRIGLMMLDHFREVLNHVRQEPLSDLDDDDDDDDDIVELRSGTLKDEHVSFYTVLREINKTLENSPQVGPMKHNIRNATGTHRGNTKRSDQHSMSNKSQKKEGKHKKVNDKKTKGQSQVQQREVAVQSTSNEESVNNPVEMSEPQTNNVATNVTTLAGDDTSDPHFKFYYVLKYLHAQTQEGKPVEAIVILQKEESNDSNRNSDQNNQTDNVSSNIPPDDSHQTDQTVQNDQPDTADQNNQNSANDHSNRNHDESQTDKKEQPDKKGCNSQTKRQNDQKNRNINKDTNDQTDQKGQNSQKDQNIEMDQNGQKIDHGQTTRTNQCDQIDEADSATSIEQTSQTHCHSNKKNNKAEHSNCKTTKEDPMEWSQSNQNDQAPSSNAPGTNNQTSRNNQTQQNNRAKNSNQSTGNNQSHHSHSSNQNNQSNQTRQRNQCSQANPTDKPGPSNQSQSKQRQEKVDCSQQERESNIDRQNRPHSCRDANANARKVQRAKNKRPKRREVRRNSARIAHLTTLRRRLQMPDFQFNGLGAGEIGGFEVVVNMDDASGGATGGTNISGGTMPRRNLTADQILDDGNIYVAHMNGAQSSAEVIQQVMGSIIRQGLVPGVTSDAHVMHVYVPNMGQNSGSTSANPTNDQTEDQPNRNQNQNENENQNQSENQSQNPSENPTQNQNQNQNETGNQQDQAQRQSHWSSRVHRQRFATRANHNMFRRLHNSYARHYTVPLENVIYDRFLQCTSFMGREAARLSHHTRSHEPGLVYRPECTMGQIQNNVEMLYNHYTRNPLSPNRLLIALTILLRESSSFTTGRFLAPHELVPLRQPLSEYAHQVLGRDFNPADGDELIDGIFQRNAAFLRRVPEITPMRQNVDIIETMRGVLSRFISQVMYCVTIHSPEIFFDRFRLIFPRMFLELCGYMSYCCLEGTEGLRTIYRSFIIDVVSDVDETIRDLLMSVSMDNIFGFLNRVQNCRLRNIQFVRMLPGTGAEGEQTNEEARAQASGETSAQASAQASARASTQASEQRSAQTSTQAQRKAQTNTQTSAQTSAQASGEPSRQRNDSAAEARSRIPTESHAGRRRPHETIYDSEDDSPRVGLDNGMIDRNEPFVEHLFGQIRDRLRTFVNEEIDLTRGDDDEPMRIINVPPHVLSIPLPTGGFPSGVRIPPSASPRPPTSNGDANDAVPCISISSSSGDDSNSSTSSRLCQPSKSDHQPMSSSADSQSSVEENYVPPANIRQHWGEEWEPTFRRDRQAQSGAQAHAQPPSDAYMSGMPSKKRRCVRQSRPPTTLNGFIQESMGEVNVSMDGVAEDDRVRAMFNEHFRDLARSRAENSVDYSARRFPGVGIFLRGSSTTDPNAPLPDFSDSSEGL